MTHGVVNHRNLRCCGCCAVVAVVVHFYSYDGLRADAGMTGVYG